MRRAINKRLSHTHRPKHWSGTASIVDLNNNNEDISLTLHNDRKLRSACHASQSTSLTGGPSSKQDVPLLYHSSFHIPSCTMYGVLDDDFKVTSRSAEIIEWIKNQTNWIVWTNKDELVLSWSAVWIAEVDDRPNILRCWWFAAVELNAANAANGEP